MVPISPQAYSAEAVVFDTKSLFDYKQRLDERRAKRALAEQEAVENYLKELPKLVNPAGMKTNDIPDFLKMQQEFRQLSNKYKVTKNPLDKLALESKADGYHFKVKKYRPFNSEYLTGVTPNTDFFRNFGMICPQGETRDAKDASKLYKNITIMYQQPPRGGTIGNGIRVWQWGGGSQNPTSGQMNDNVEMITYRGSRVAAANQFVIVQAS